MSDAEKICSAENCETGQVEKEYGLWTGLTVLFRVVRERLCHMGTCKQ